MNELALFAGAGGGLLASRMLGWRTRCAVELDSYAREVLLARQRDGMLDMFPIWDDVQTFDGRPWHGTIDVISGGFPCQDISPAGSRAGITGAKSGLWRHFHRIIAEVQPTYAFIENSAHLRTNGLVTVLQDLAAIGFDAEWCVLGGQAVGAPHIRKRMWIVAYNNNNRQRALAIDAEVATPPQPVPAGGAPSGSPDVADADGHDLLVQPGRTAGPCVEETLQRGSPCWRPVDCFTGVDDGVAHRMDRVRATGNGQISAVAALAWRMLTARIAAHRP